MMTNCPKCGCSREEPLIIEKRFLFWLVKITDPLGLKRFNAWDKIPLSISRELMIRIIKAALPSMTIPEGLIQPVKIDDIGNAVLCFNCGLKKFSIGD